MLHGTEPSAEPLACLVAESPAMQRVLAAVQALASHSEPVLVRGELGTGRELVARMLHASSKRARAELVVIGAPPEPAALLPEPSSGLSAQLLELLQGGTLLIRDICELSKAVQQQIEQLLAGQSAGKAARVFDVRVIGIGEPEGRWAVDRLHAIDVPALRERVEDLAPLATMFVHQYALALGRGAIQLSSRALARLALYPWPGNVAELKAVCRRLVLRATSDRIHISDVDAALPVIAERIPLEEMSFEDMVRSKLSGLLRDMEGYPIHGLYEEILARVERPLLKLVMEHTGGNQMRAAEILGLNRNTLRRKLSERGLRAGARRARSKGSQSRTAGSSRAG